MKRGCARASRQQCPSTYLHDRWPARICASHRAGYSCNCSTRSRSLWGLAEAGMIHYQFALQVHCSPSLSVSVDGPEEQSGQLVGSESEVSKFCSQQEDKHIVNKGRLTFRKSGSKTACTSCSNLVVPTVTKTVPPAAIYSDKNGGQQSYFAARRAVASTLSER